MRVRIASILLLGLFVMGCGSSGSVYQLPEAQQKGLTYQTYQELPDEAFDAVTKAVKNYNSKMLMEEGWEITSYDANTHTLQTNWREAGSSSSATGGRVMGSDTDERYRLKAKVTDEDSGSRVLFKLQKQVRMSEWQTFDVKKKTAKNHLGPLFKQLEEEGLTMQG